MQRLKLMSDTPQANMHNGDRTHLDIYMSTETHLLCEQSMHIHTHTRSHTHNVPVQFFPVPYCSVCSRPLSVSSEPLSPLQWIHFAQACPCHTHTALTQTRHTHTHTSTGKTEETGKLQMNLATALLCSLLWNKWRLCQIHPKRVWKSISSLMNYEKLNDRWGFQSLPSWLFLHQTLICPYWNMWEETMCLKQVIRFHPDLKAQTDSMLYTGRGSEWGHCQVICIDCALFISEVPECARTEFEDILWYLYKLWQNNADWSARLCSHCCCFCTETVELMNFYSCFCRSKPVVAHLMVEGSLHKCECVYVCLQCALKMLTRWS